MVVGVENWLKLMIELVVVVAVVEVAEIELAVEDVVVLVEKTCYLPMMNSIVSVR